VKLPFFLAEGYGYNIVYSSVQCFGNSDFRWLVTDPQFPAIADRNQIPTAALFRKADWAHAGGFKDWPAGGQHVPEDQEFWARLMAHGCRVKSIREPLLLCRVHQEDLTSAGDMDYGTAQGSPDRGCSPTGQSASRHGRKGPNNQPLVQFRSGRWRHSARFLTRPTLCTIGGADTLLHGLAEEVARRGFRLVVITSLTLPDVVPDNLRSFTALTPHVYPLAQLFHDSGTSEQFVCRLISSITYLTCSLPAVSWSTPPARLQAEHPTLTVIDQLFNDEVHAPNNRRYRSYIDSTIVPSESLKASLLRSTPNDPGQIDIVPHSVEIPDADSGPVYQLRRPCPCLPTR
jgi:hypothetical protein